jgi:hypothetical protein
MTNTNNTPNPTQFREGDIVALIADTSFNALGVTLPSGEKGRIADIDPEDSSQLVLRVSRRHKQLWRWHYFIPVSSDCVR